MTNENNRKHIIEPEPIHASSHLDRNNGLSIQEQKIFKNLQKKFLNEKNIQDYEDIILREQRPFSASSLDSTPETAIVNLPKIWYIEIFFVPSSSDICIKFTTNKPKNSSHEFELNLFNKIDVSINSCEEFDLVSPISKYSILLDKDTVSAYFSVIPHSSHSFVRFLLWIPNKDSELVRAPIDFKHDIDLETRIWLEQKDNKKFLKYQLRYGLGEGDYKYGGECEITNDSKSYLNQLYDKINRLPVHISNYDDLREELESLGVYFYNKLFSHELKQMYEMKIRDKVQTWMLILDKDTSQIPWELIVPDYKDKEKGYQFLCERFEMSRWLYGEDIKRSPLKEISLEPLALVAFDPLNGNMKGIHKEKKILKKMMYPNVTFIKPTHNNVINLLKSENMNGFNGLHLSGNCQLDTLNGYQFQLQNNGLLGFMDFNKSENRAFGQVRPFVFLNFCESGRSTESCVDSTGWVEILIGQVGVSCIIATLWKAIDESAAEFSSAFYEQFRNGETLGKAMQNARDTIKYKGDPTWLCYVLYGDPRARVRR